MHILFLGGGEKFELLEATLDFIVHGQPATTVMINYRKRSSIGTLQLSADGGERKRQLLKIGAPIDLLHNIKRFVNLIISIHGDISMRLLIQS